MAMAPITIRMLCGFNEGDYKSNTTNFADPAPPYDVPAGKRLIVEAISVYGFVPQGQRLDAFLETSGVAPDQFYQLPLQFQGTHQYVDEKRDVWTMNSVTRAYVAPGAKLGPRAKRDATTGRSTVLVTVTGMLEDI